MIQKIYIQKHSNDGNHTLEMKDVIYKFKINVYTVLIAKKLLQQE